MSRKRGSFLQFFRAVLFFADSIRKKGFQPVKSLYFCVGEQKKRTAILKHVNRLKVLLRNSALQVVALKIQLN